MNKFNPKTILDNLTLAADWVGLRLVTETTTYRLVRDGKPQTNARETTRGIMVEVLADGQFAYYGTNRLDPVSIQQAAEKALEQAKLAARYAVHKFTVDARPAAVGEFISPFKRGVDTLSAGELNELLLKSNEALKVSDKIVSVNSLAQIVETEFHYVSTNGSDVKQNFLMVSSDFVATAQDGPVVQKRTDGGMLAKSHQTGMEAFDETAILDRCRIIGEQAVELLSAEDCPTAKTDLVLAPDQMMLQIHESVGHALEIDRILGDERNYAGWSFVHLEDIGKLQYGSELMNITFDPSVEHQLASYAFDDGGLKAERQFIIKNGKLVRALGGLESQIRSGVPGVANFRASSWNRQPIDRMANLNLEPGNSTFEEIISSIEHGVYMETNRSWSIDDYRNKFQFGCEYGKLIEKGKLTRTVKNPNYRAITTPFWSSLKMLGNRDTFKIYGTPYCGKGEPNQTIRVGHASPVACFENVEVFGGA
ncbi:MAG: TldD/PmbA family protein [FCB group bacterium]|nr:TldD/PmbA family protein [FCB group bacterium]